MWKYHNEALKNPSYQLEGLMDCFREEMSYFQPYYYSVEPYHYPMDESGCIKPPEPQWNKQQWDTIKQLEARVLFLSNKVNEMRANASKRKPNRYKDKYIL